MGEGDKIGRFQYSSCDESCSAVSPGRGSFSKYVFGGRNFSKAIRSKAVRGEVLSYNVLDEPLVMHVEDCTLVVHYKEKLDSTTLMVINPIVKKRRKAVSKLEEVFA